MSESVIHLEMCAHPAVQRTATGLFHSSASAVYVFVCSCVLKSGRKRVTFPCWDLRAAVAMFLWPSVTVSELFLQQPKAWSHKHTHIQGHSGLCSTTENITALTVTSSPKWSPHVRDSVKDTDMMTRRLKSQITQKRLCYKSAWGDIREQSDIFISLSISIFYLNTAESDLNSQADLENNN